MKSLGLALLALLLCPSPGESGARGEGSCRGDHHSYISAPTTGALPAPEGIKRLFNGLLVLRRGPSFSEVHRASY